MWARSLGHSGYVLGMNWTWLTMGCLAGVLLWFTTDQFVLLVLGVLIGVALGIGFGTGSKSE